MIAISELYYNQEVNGPFCNQSLLIEEPKDHIKPPMDEVTSTVSEELELENQTEVPMGTEQEPMGNKVAAVLGKIIGGASLSFGIIYIFPAISEFLDPLDLRSPTKKLSGPEKIGYYLGAVGCPLFVIIFGWIVLMRACENKFKWSIIFTYVGLPLAAFLIFMIYYN